MVFLPVIIIFIPILTSILIYMFKSPKVNLLAFPAQAAMIVLAVIYYTRFIGDFDATFIVLGGWDSRIGISLVNDHLSMIFVSLALFSWTMVLLYSYSAKKDYATFLFFLMFLQGVFLGLLQTNDLFNAFVFVELTTIVVTILVAFKKTGDAMRSGIYYLLLNTSGVLLFLIGIVLIYNVFGSINIRFVTETAHLHKDSTILVFAYILMMAGISVKSGLFPVFTWLPKAHGAAQSSVSALLSGLIVKGGLYLFIRMNFMFEGAEIPYTAFFFAIGALTAYIGIVFAISQKDLKQMLAYSTVSQVGIIMMGLSSLDAQIFYGGVLHILNHAIFKMLLFLIVGMIVRVYLTKNVDEIRGMFRTMPLVSLTMVVAMLAITGMPFLNGYVSKSVILYGHEADPFRYWVVFIANIGTAVLFLKIAPILLGPKHLSYPISHIRQDIVLVTLAMMLLVLGNYFILVEDPQFFPVDFGHLSPLSLSAFLDYFVTIGLAFLVYRLVIVKDFALTRSLRGFKLSFEHANYLFVAYTVVMVAYFLLFQSVN